MDLEIQAALALASGPPKTPTSIHSESTAPDAPKQAVPDASATVPAAAAMPVVSTPVLVVTETPSRFAVYDLTERRLSIEAATDRYGTYRTGRKDGGADVLGRLKRCPPGGCLGTGTYDCGGGETPHRLNTNVIARTGLSEDFDDISPARLDKTIRALQALGLMFWIWSTYSHDESKGVGRFRVVVPFLEELPVAHPDVWTEARLRMLPAIGIDPIDTDDTAGTVSQVAYLPAKPTDDAKHEARFFSGELLDWRKFIDLADISVPKVRPEDYPPVIAENLDPVDLASIRDRLKSVRDPELAALFKRILEGKAPVPPPGEEGHVQREPVWRRLTAVMALLREPEESREAWLEVLRASHADEVAASPGDSTDWTHIRDLFDRAIAKAPEMKAQAAARRRAQIENFMARLQRRRADPVSLSVADRPESSVLLIKLATQNIFFARRADGFDIDAPLSKTSAEDFLIAKGVATDRKALAKVISLADPPMPNGIFEWVFGLVCAPREPGFVRGADGLLVLNTWGMPNLMPMAGEWPRLRQALLWLVNHDEAGLKWLLNWCACKLQHPGQLVGTAPVFVGAQGSGKNTLYRALAECLGPANCTVLGESDLESRFNSHYAAKLLVLANELVDDHERDFSLGDQLKAWVTDRDAWIEAKGVTRFKTENRKAVIVATNKLKPIRIESTDRRWSVFSNWTEPKGTPHETLLASLHDPKKVDTFTPDALLEVAAFWHDMLRAKVDYRMARTPFDNDARREMQRLSESAGAQFARDLREAPEPKRRLDQLRKVTVMPFSGTSPAKDTLMGFEPKDLYLAFQNYCEEEGITYATTKRLFAAALARDGWVSIRTDSKRGWAPPWQGQAITHVSKD